MRITWRNVPAKNTRESGTSRNDASADFKFSKGLKYVALTRGALAGMAEKVYLNDGRTGSETATILSIAVRPISGRMCV